MKTSKTFSPNIAISIVASVCFSGVFYISKFLCGNGEVYEESFTSHDTGSLRCYADDSTGD